MKVHKVNRQLLAILMALTLILTLFPVGVSAAPTTFEDYVVGKLKNFETSFDITSFAISGRWDGNKAMNMTLDVILGHPELFYVETSVGVSYTSSSYKITDINYAFPKTQYAEKKKKYDAACKAAADTLTDDMTPAEKVLRLHDFLAARTAYDTSLTKYTSYDALVNGSAVCQGYSLAFSQLLHNAGIECEIVRSESMNHSWNYVKLGGKWYHADVTWDDALYNNSDLLGNVYHSNFLLSDAAIKKTSQPHKNWLTENALRGKIPAATSTTYDNYYWRDIETEMWKYGKNWYWAAMDETSPGVNNNYKSMTITSAADAAKIYTNLIQGSFSGKKQKSIYRFESTWFADGTEGSGKLQWWQESYTKITLHDGKVYFNTPKLLCAYDIKTGEVTTAGKPKLVNGQYIYGLTARGNTLYVTLKSDPGDTDLYKKYELAA
ncbi:hypothetical protein FACS189499_03240 [Clostridia bacterium]|nr:hypothetical protein FACS189499_03240 [Clostridia bacterium]